MNKNIIFLILILISGACVKHQNKNTQIKDSSKSIRIVSLAQSVSQEIESLGLTNNIVGATSYCNVSKRNKDLIIGTSTDINIEKIIMLKPDVVVTSTLTEPNITETLIKSGIKVHCLGKASSFKEICNEFIELGTVLGKEDKAKQIVAQSQKTVDSLKLLIPAQAKKQKIFFQIGAKPLYSVIPNTYMNEYIELANCTNIAFDMTSGSITREAVIQRNPDIIFVVTMGIVGEEEVSIWKNYKQINAVKNNKIFVLNSDIACAPTPITFTETFKVIIKNLYGN